MKLIENSLWTTDLQSFDVFEAQFLTLLTLGYNWQELSIFCFGPFFALLDIFMTHNYDIIIYES